MNVFAYLIALIISFIVVMCCTNNPNRTEDITPDTTKTELDSLNMNKQNKIEK